MIRSIQNFQWSEAWAATKLFLMLAGVIGLAVWLAQPLPWWITAATLFVIAVAWFLCFHIVCSVREHLSRRQNDRDREQVDRVIERLNRRAGPGGDHTMLRKRFVRFDPDTGDEIFKFEA